LTIKTRDGKRLLGIEVMMERVLKKKVVKNIILNNMDKILKFFGASVIGDIGKVIDDLLQVMRRETPLRIRSYKY